MPISRRDFFRHSGEAALWTTLLAGLEAKAQEESQEPLAPGETDFASFWLQTFAPPSAPRRGESQPAPGSDVQFVHFGPKGPRYLADIALTPEDLASVSGDAMIDISPGCFRSGNAAGTSDSGFVDSAQLRFEVRQTMTLMGILPELAWVSAAAVSLVKKGAKMPSTQSLNFKTVAGENAINKIVLPGGTGSVLLNVSVANKPSPFLAALKELVTVAETVVPALGLPAISMPALIGFSAVCGKIEGHGKYLMSTKEPQDIVVTQGAWGTRRSKAVPFPPGDYLMYPFNHRAIVQPEFHDLTIEDGYLVNTKLDTSLTLAERAEQTAPGLTYVTMRVNVAPVPAAAPKTQG